MFERQRNDNWRDGVVVTASALQSVYLSVFAKSSQDKIKKGNSQLPCLALSIKKGLCGEQARKLLSRLVFKQNLTGCFHLYVADRWRTRAPTG